MGGPDSTGSLEGQLASLRRAYRRDLPDQRIALQRALGALHDGSDIEAVARDVQHRVHRLAGSAGSYGCADLGERARAIDAPLRHALERQPVDEGRLRAICEAGLPPLIDALRTAEIDPSG